MLTVGNNTAWWICSEWRGFRLSLGHKAYNYENASGKRRELERVGDSGEGNGESGEGKGESGGGRKGESKLTCMGYILT